VQTNENKNKIIYHGASTGVMARWNMKPLQYFALQCPLTSCTKITELVGFVVGYSIGISGGVRGFCIVSTEEGVGYGAVGLRRAQRNEEKREQRKK
jgi:hypothetical protein